jgi:hypothetical protein
MTYAGLESETDLHIVMAIATVVVHYVNSVSLSLSLRGRFLLGFPDVAQS